MEAAFTEVVGDASIVRGSRAWGNRLRKRAQHLTSQLDTDYMELGRILYDVYDCPIDGDPKNASILVSWGHASFKDYVESELGLHYKKAQRLRSIWYVLEIVLKDLPVDVKLSLVKLGASKMRELTRVLDKDNVDRWLAIAENDSYVTLLNKIQAAVLKARKEALEEKIGDDSASDEGMPFPADAVALGGGEARGASDGVPGFDGVNAEVGDAAAAAANDIGLFGTDELKMESFMLAPTQQLNVLTALERASELTKSSKKGYNLDMICLDFLATNDFKAASQQAESRNTYLKKIEKLLGVRIIAVDAKDQSNVIYGINTLNTLAGTDVEP